MVFEADDIPERIGNEFFINGNGSLGSNRIVSEQFTSRFGTCSGIPCYGQSPIAGKCLTYIQRHFPRNLLRYTICFNCVKRLNAQMKRPAKNLRRTMNVRWHAVCNATNTLSRYSPKSTIMSTTNLRSKAANRPSAPGRAAGHTKPKALLSVL